MIDAAPARFSTTTGWPRYSLILGATSRAEISVPPPATDGTITRIGCAGYFSCACASAAAHRVHAAAPARAKAERQKSRKLAPPDINVQSALILPARASLVKAAISAAISVSNCPGVVGAGSAPSATQ